MTKSSVRSKPLANDGELRSEFRYRRGVALNAGFAEVTARLIGFVQWMKSIPTAKRLLRQLKAEANADELMFERKYGSVFLRRPLQAARIEEIAGIGFALLELAEEKEKPLYDIGGDFGIRSDRWNAGSDANTDAVVSRYIVPFFDYIEQRLPESEKRQGTDKSVRPPAIISESLVKFSRQHRKIGGRCFIMMRFGETAAHARIESAIKETLNKHGLVGMLARDKEFHDDLFPNILTYMHGCDFGIAVFERLETEVFNPNVALEVGYMLALRKHVLLLKDRTLRALHTDLVGKLYREFDPQKPKSTIAREIDAWLTDKGIA